MAHKSIKSIRVFCRDGLAWPGLRQLGPMLCEGLCESECCAANSHDSCTHGTSASVEWRGEKPAYGQSQCVTFGLEFTLGSDARTNELARIVESQRQRCV